jgi:ubiquinone/menaquinone biosynthesis C-methylase UbiE
MKTLLRLFFELLYHQFAFAYDFVAAVVSFGRWNDWIVEVIPFIEGRRVLEIGHGPGHLQRILLSRGLVAVGIEESPQMLRLAKRRLDKQFSTNSEFAHPEPAHRFGCTHINLTRGLAQHLPFANSAFDTVIATFPSEYIFNPATLTEVRRCLINGGRFIVLPVAMPKNRFLLWLFRVTGEAPSDALKIIQEKLAEPFIESSFDLETHVLDTASGTLIVIVAKNRVTISAR